MSYSSRINLYWPAGLLLLVAVLCTLFWRSQAAALEQALERGNRHELIPGLDFAFAEKTVGGFPFRLDVVLSGVTFSLRSGDGEYAWRTEKLALHVQSYSRERWIFEAAGLQSFALPPEAAGAVPRVILVNPALLRASALLNDGKPVRFDLDLWGANGKDGTQGAAQDRSFGAARAQFHVIARAGGTYETALKVENAHIGSETPLPLIELRGVLTKSQTLDALFARKAGLAEAANLWRDDKGVLAVSSLALNWPDRSADLKGELSLSPANQVTGTLRGEGGIALNFADGGWRLEAPSAPVGTGP